MFPAALRDGRLATKDYVFGVRAFGGAKAWPVDAFGDGRVINDRVGFVDVVLIGDAATRTVRAYRREGREFVPTQKPGRLGADGTEWVVTEDALIGPDGATLNRIPGHIAYWFAWAGYLGDQAELYQPID